MKLFILSFKFGFKCALNFWTWVGKSPLVNLYFILTFEERFLFFLNNYAFVLTIRFFLPWPLYHIKIWVSFRSENKCLLGAPFILVGEILLSSLDYHFFCSSLSLLPKILLSLTSLLISCSFIRTFIPLHTQTHTQGRGGRGKSEENRATHPKKRLQCTPEICRHCQLISLLYTFGIISLVKWW